MVLGEPIFSTFLIFALRAVSQAAGLASRILEDIANLDKPINKTSLTNLPFGAKLTFNQSIRSGNLGSLTDLWTRLGLEEEFRGQFGTDEEYWQSPLSFWQLYTQFKGKKISRTENRK